MSEDEETFVDIKEIKTGKMRRSPCERLLRDVLPQALIGGPLALLFAWTLFITGGAGLFPAWCIGALLPCGFWAVLGPGDYFKRTFACYCVASVMWLPAVVMTVVAGYFTSGVWQAIATILCLSFLALLVSQIMFWPLRLFAGWEIINPNEVSSGDVGTQKRETQFTTADLFKVTTLVVILLVVFRRLWPMNDGLYWSDSLLAFGLLLVTQIVLFPALMFHLRKKKKAVWWYLTAVGLVLAGVPVLLIVGSGGLEKFFWIFFWIVNVLVGVYGVGGISLYGVGVICDHGFRLNYKKNGKLRTYPN